MRSAWRSPRATSRSYFNRPGHTVIDHHTYALVSDGDVMEGVRVRSREPRRSPRPRQADLSLRRQPRHARRSALARRCARTSARATPRTAGTCSARRQGRHRSRCARRRDPRREGRDRAAVDHRRSTRRSATARRRRRAPAAAHGSPLGEAEVAATKQALGWDPEREVPRPRRVRERTSARPCSAVQAAHAAWREQLAAYKARPPGRSAAQLELAIKGELPAGWDQGLPTFSGAATATRAASGKVMAAIAAKIPWLFGGDADLGGSTKTIVARRRLRAPRRGPQPPLRHPRARDGRDRQRHALSRRHASAIVATFFVFSDYMRPSGAARGAQQAGRDLRVDARLDRPRRGRPDPPAGRAPDGAARDAEPRGVPARATATRPPRAGAIAIARTHGPTGLVLSRQDLPIAHAARRARRREGRLRARRRHRRDRDRDGLRGLARDGRARRAREAERRRCASCRCRAGSCSPSSTPRTATPCCRRSSAARLGRGRRDDGLARVRSATAASRSASIASVRRRRREILMEQLGITSAAVVVAVKRLMTDR